MNGSRAEVPVAPADPPWLTQLLACPQCHSPVGERPDGWHCRSCGVVGLRTLGFADFLGGQDRLPLANGEFLDVASDSAAGATLAALASSGSDVEELARRGGEIQAEAAGRSLWPEGRRRICDRYHAGVRRRNEDAAPAGGEALLAKIDAKLAELSWPELGTDLVLEAGGGMGYFLPAFSRRFRRVVFADASSLALVQAAALAREHGLSNVAFVRADVSSLPFASERFDLVHENGVIEHVHEPRRMVQEAVRVRSPGGYFVCVSPNRYSLAPEPHFGLPLYGIVPRAVRQALVPRLRGFDDGVGTTLLSLHQLRQELGSVLTGDDLAVYFLPAHLPFTARQTRLRRLVRRTLAAPGVGTIASHVLNVTLLAVMPQHIAVARRSS